MLGKLAAGEIAVGEVVTGEIVLGKLCWGNDLTPIPPYWNSPLPIYMRFGTVPCLCLLSYFYHEGDKKGIKELQFASCDKFKVVFDVASFPSPPN